jgi:hypothetical protein
VIIGWRRRERPHEGAWRRRGGRLKLPHEPKPSPSRGLAVRVRDRGEREVYERIVELYVMIAEELEKLL